jgi:cytochrome P450
MDTLDPREDEPLDDQSNPFTWYARMRREAPGWVNPERGTLSLFRYDDVQRAFSDWEAFSSARGGAGLSPIGSSIISSDPPRHRQLRNLVTLAFTPRAVNQLAPRISAIISELLDEVASAGRMDFIESFAYPLPVIVIAEMLGIPPADRAQFRLWSDAIVSLGNEPGKLNIMDAQREMAMYFGKLIAERSAEPRDDLISHLIAAEIDGERLTPMELIGFCVLLLVAGNETTTNLLSNSILCFDEHPETYERLRANPSLVANAVEEVLRYRSPVQLMFRSATGASNIAGVTTHSGQGVVLFIGSANRDEEQFPNADAFDIERTPNRHLAFGYGIHFCLGAPLARLEAKLALEALTTRFRDIRRVPNAPLPWMKSDIVYGVSSLPITYQAR